MTTVQNIGGVILLVSPKNAEKQNIVLVYTGECMKSLAGGKNPVRIS